MLLWMDICGAQEFQFIVSTFLASLCGARKSFSLLFGAELSNCGFWVAEAERQLDMDDIDFSNGDVAISKESLCPPKVLDWGFKRGK